MKKVLFTVGLSNGETIAEEKGNFQTQEGALSPWNRLLSYCSENQLTITSLSLYTRDGKRWNLPSSGKNPKFKETTMAEKPILYRVFRKMGADIMNGEKENVEIYTVAEAVFKDNRKIQVWVDDNTENSWSFIF